MHKQVASSQIPSFFFKNLRFSPIDCMSRAIVSCQLYENCTISLQEEKISTCDNKLADYISFEYKLVPSIYEKSFFLLHTFYSFFLILVISSRNSSICENNLINLVSSGVLTSPEYPNFESLKNCSTTIIVPEGKIIKIYLTDIHLDEYDKNGEYVL